MKKGFTLIELLVVISIITVLSTIGLTTFRGVTSRAQDTQRKQDLNQLSTALEIYLEKNNQYIPNIASCPNSTFYTQIQPFFNSSNLPKDPSTGNAYCYTSSNDKSYQLWATLSDNSKFMLSKAASDSEPVITITNTSPTPTPTSTTAPTSTPTATSTPPTLAAVQITTVDPQASFYGTFQSHNQKVVANSNGIFMTYLHSTINKDSNSETSTWRLARSTDGGTTFNTIFEVANAHTRAPVIETDSLNNIYLIEANFSDNTAAHFYKFSSSNNYTSPVVQTTLSLGTISAKYAMEIDEVRSQLYFFTLSGTFTILNLNGTIKSQFLLTPQNILNSNGQIIQMEYPHLYLDENNNLYAAWTTVNYTFGSNYWTIHFIRSRDGAVTWEKPTGLNTGQTLTRPIDPSESGPTVKITLDDETTSPSYKNWLSTFIVKGGKVHFVYHANSPNRQHYVRYDLAQANIDLNIHPTFKGATISVANLDGFCTTQKGVGSTIYCINMSISPYAVAVLRSDDNGSTWHDHVIAPSLPPETSVYALSGSPQITSDGFIIGTYTENVSSISEVKFFKVSK